MSFNWEPLPGSITLLDPAIAFSTNTISIPVTDTTGLVRLELVSGSIPEGIAISDLVLTGTPSSCVSGQPTNYRFILRALAGDVNFGTREFELNVFCFWTKPTGYKLGFVEERTNSAVQLPVVDQVQGIDFQLISGSLPPGMEVTGKTIHGTVLETSQVVEYRFVIRATNQLGQVTDRTFSIDVHGPDSPVWITPPGPLSLNNDETYYVLDSTLVDFQLVAVDTDLTAGQVLRYFIQDGDGFLPPGLSLSTDGKITGLVSPVMSLEDNIGLVDQPILDDANIDFGRYPKIGLDTFGYDQYVYDYSLGLPDSLKLNRSYEFFVSVTDGFEVVKQKFGIYVVGDDFLRADNTYLQVGTNAYTADATALRPPVWLTPSLLGTRRANNYISIFLDTLDPAPGAGPIIYTLEDRNPDNSFSFIPTGLFIDFTNGELFGRVPYQAAITKDFKFTVTAKKYHLREFNGEQLFISVIDNISIGETSFKVSPIDQDRAQAMIGGTLRIGEFQYVIADYQVPVNVIEYGFLSVNSPLQTEIEKNTVLILNLTISGFDDFVSSASKTFTLRMIGEIENTINWATNFDLGSIRSNVPSTKKIQAVSVVPGADIDYRIISGNLPPGLTLGRSGYIIGRVQRMPVTINRVATSERLGKTSFDVATTVYDSGYTKFDVSRWDQDSISSSFFSPGITLFDNDNLSFDLGRTTFDRVYRFTVAARDQFRFSEIIDEFFLRIDLDNNVSFSNISIQPYQRSDLRTQFMGLMDNNGIFDFDKIYRLGDPNFGIQYDLKMLLYSGIETRNLDEYVPILEKNIGAMRLQLGDVKTAVAKLPGSNIIEYEVVYIEVIDPREFNGRSVSKSINIGTHSYGQGEFDTVYPVSISNMRSRIRELVVNNAGTEQQIKSETSFLPLWMITPQSSSLPALGYIKAIPLCYCLPGTSEGILINIQKSEFNFTGIDYKIDRFVVDLTNELTGSKYVVFKSPAHTI